MNRREFLATAGILTVDPLRSSGMPEAGKTMAAVIGHTGRGDYGHGLETIFANRPGIELVALADPDPEGRAGTAARIGSPRQYAGYKEMLEKEHPQLVSVAMRHADQHHEIILAALRAGAHVYSEKPFTRTPAEADDILAEAEGRGLKIAVAHTLRLTPGIMCLRQVLSEGRLGDLMEMRAFGKQDSRAGGEDMMVLGTHLFDLMRMLAGDPLWCAARVLWQGRDITPSDARLVKDNVGPVAGDQVFAHFAFSGGVNGTFTSDAKLRDTAGHWGIELHCSKGVARIACDIVPNVFFHPNAGWKSGGKIDKWEPLDGVSQDPLPPQNINPVTDWLDSIVQNREPVCSGRNGAWAVEMTVAVYYAALGAGRIAFPLKDRRHPLSAEVEMR